MCVRVRVRAHSGVREKQNEACLYYLKPVVAHPEVHSALPHCFLFYSFFPAPVCVTGDTGQSGSSAYVRLLRTIT